MITSVHSACSAHAQSVFIATATNGSCGNTTQAHCPHTYIHIYTYLTNSRSSALMPWSSYWYIHTQHQIYTATVTSGSVTTHDCPTHSSTVSTAHTIQCVHATTMATFSSTACSPCDHSNDSWQQTPPPCCTHSLPTSQCMHCQQLASPLVVGGA